MERLRRITPRLAEDYAKKSEKTVKRDVNALEEMGLVVKEGKGKRVGYRANIEIIFGFLPGAIE
jgi:predicted DNA-binding transcriptional regulator YafY